MRKEVLDREKWKKKNISLTMVLFCSAHRLQSKQGFRPSIWEGVSSRREFRRVLLKQKIIIQKAEEGSGEASQREGIREGSIIDVH